MSQTLFKEINYTLGKLIEDIAMGELGLPDLQRPFVWPNKKVRDLFDSMYRGYPVGYLLFWESGAADRTRTIGTDRKSRPARLLIIDGQQRLTSLYAILKAIPVKRENFREEKIQIAFRPLDERFEVCDAAIRRNPAWIPDISAVWATDTTLFDLVEDYLDRLGRPLEPDQKKGVQRALQNLAQLTTFPFTALELSADLDEEQVAEVFVRINSKGKTLNQADFILTLMSVFHDDLRYQLEEFCRQCRTPSRITASPFNHFLEPKPDQLLRVCVGLGFRRARLQHVYSILRGKDLETGQVSEELREQQFARLREAQRYTLDLQNWHEFLKALDDAGYRSGQFVSSLNAILYSYAFFLIGRRDYGLPLREASSVIARWFFFVALTGRYTDSPETRMEQDLADLRGVETGEEFVRRINRKIESTFTPDYWNITLPSELVSSSPRSPGLFAYYAALVLLEAEVLFSRRKVTRLMDPATRARRSALERHHLFPKAFLKRRGVASVRETNQVANYALLEWPDNSDISDQDPSQYFQPFISELDHETRDRQMFWHALPEGWPTMDYGEFLRERRVRIANVVHEGFQVLCQRQGHRTEAVATKETVFEELQTGGATSGALTGLALSLLSEQTRPIIEDLLQEPPKEIATLTDEVGAYLDDLEKHKDDYPEVDLDLPRRLADRLLVLFESVPPNGPTAYRSLVQAAAGYFILDDDSIHDHRSSRGFEDDDEVVSVIETVLEEINDSY